MTHPNRNSVKASVHPGFWCWGCDAAIVSAGRKCPVCGTRNYNALKNRLSVSDIRRIKE
jgi:rRNA maturation endonuclease Nob1